MKPLLPMLAALLVALPAFAGAPKCPAMGAGGQTTNWGSDYRERVQEVFNTVRQAAGDGLDPQLQLININDLPKHGGTRMVDGSPLSALAKGTLGLEHDAVIYTFGIFEIACDEAQLAFFMSHEMKHIKKGPDGKNHLDRVNACKKAAVQEWLKDKDISSYYQGVDDQTGNKAVLAAFDKEKGRDVAARCVKPVENEADAFAAQLAPKLPYKVENDPNNPDPNRDARVQAFNDAEVWLKALDMSQDDPGHGTLADRAAEMARVATEEARKKHEAREAEMLQSIQPGY